MNEEMVGKKCAICGREFKTLAKEPLKICGDCAFEIGNGNLGLLTGVCMEEGEKVK